MIFLLIACWDDNILDEMGQIQYIITTYWIESCLQVWSSSGPLSSRLYLFLSPPLRRLLDLSQAQLGSLPPLLPLGFSHRGHSSSVAGGWHICSSGSLWSRPQRCWSSSKTALAGRVSPLGHAPSSANSRVTGGDAGASPVLEVSSPCPHSVRSLHQLSQPLHRCVSSHFSWHLDDTVFLAYFPLSLLKVSFSHCLSVSLLHATESCL